MGVPIIYSKFNYDNLKTLCVIVSINKIRQDTLCTQWIWDMKVNNEGYIAMPSSDLNCIADKD